MTEISANTVALWISREFDSGTYTPLLEATIVTLRARLPNQSEENVAELAERVLPRLQEPLDRIREKALEDGIQPQFDLSIDADALYIRVVKTEANNFVTKLRALTPEHFETFCARVLGALGARGTRLGGSLDGGVDFVARDLQLCEPAPVGARVLVVGQAKRYAVTNSVSETELRAFVGGALRRLSDHEDTMAFRTGTLSPVVFAFWTTAEFQPSARRYARAMGLWYLSGIALAQLALRVGLTTAEL